MDRLPPNVTNLPPNVAQQTLNTWSSGNGSADTGQLQLLASLLAQRRAGNNLPASQGKVVASVLLLFFGMLLLPLFTFMIFLVVLSAG